MAAPGERGGSGGSRLGAPAPSFVKGNTGGFVVFLHELKGEQAGGCPGCAGLRRCCGSLGVPWSWFGVSVRCPWGARCVPGVSGVSVGCSVCFLGSSDPRVIPAAVGATPQYRGCRLAGPGERVVVNGKRNWKSK